MSSVTKKWQTLNIMSPQKKIFLIWILKEFFPKDIIQELVLLWHCRFNGIYYGQHYFECVCNQILKFHNCDPEISETSFYNIYLMVIDNKRKNRDTCEFCETQWTRKREEFCNSYDSSSKVLLLCPCGNLGSSFPCSDCWDKSATACSFRKRGALGAELSATTCSYPECKNIICNESMLCKKHIKCNHCGAHFIKNISSPDYYLSYKCSYCQIEMKMKSHYTMRLIETWNGKFMSALVKYDYKIIKYY